MVRLKTMPAIVAAIILTIGMLAGGGAVMAYQGHMFAAQSNLQRALHQLQIAIPDKAGHRDSAINLVNQALQQTNLGIAAGAR